MSKQLSSFQPQLKSLLDGLVGYWKLDESSGNASDSSGNGLTLTNTGITYSTGKINNGAVYDASTDKFDGGNILSFTGDFTYSMWIKSSSTTTGQLMYKSAGGNVYALTYNPTGNDGLLQMNVYYSATDHYSRSSGTSLNDNNWHHIVAVINDTNDTISLYKDGVEVSYTTKHTSAFTTPANTGNQYIGNNGSDTSTFIGTIDEVASWNRALSNIEIKALYNSGNAMAYPLGSTPNSTKLYMPLNGNSVDISGNGNHGTDTAITYIGGKFGQGARFNGSSSKIVTSTKIGTVNEDKTFSLWWKPITLNSGANRDAYIAELGYGDTYSGYQFYYGRNTGVNYLGIYRDRGCVGSESVQINADFLNSNKFYLLTATLSGTTMSFYLDSVYKGSVTINTGNGTCNSQVGLYLATNRASSTYQDGILDEVIIENRAWTPQEISLYYRKSMLNYRTKSLFNLIKDFVMTGDTAVFTITGYNASLTLIQRLVAETANFIITAYDAVFKLAGAWRNPDNKSSTTYTNPDNKSSTTYTNPDNKSSTTWTNTNKNS